MFIVDTKTMVVLLTDATDKGRNRSFETASLSKVIRSLDPTGLHVVSPLMWHHHVAGSPAKPHLRCQVYLKQQGVQAPFETMLDIDPDIVLQTKLPSDMPTRVPGR